MDRGYLTLLGLLAIGVVYGLLRKKRSQTKSTSRWVNFAVVCGLLAGLFLVGKFGDDNTGFLVGLAFMVIVPILFFVALGSGLASMLRRAESKKEDTE